MKKLLTRSSLATLWLLPVVSLAQFDAETTSFRTDLLEPIIGFVNGILIPFILGIGFLVFVWGMFRYFIAGGTDEDARNKGKNLMIYATLGFVLIIIFWGIVNLLAGSTGFDQGTAVGVVPNVTI